MSAELERPILALTPHSRAESDFFAPAPPAQPRYSTAAISAPARTSTWSGAFQPHTREADTLTIQRAA